MPDATTIPKNSTRRISVLRDLLTVCRVYSEDNQFTAKPCEPDCAWDALQHFRRARLTSDGDGRYTVSVHGNLWYELCQPPPAPKPPPAGSALGGDAALRLYQQQTGFRSPEDARIQGSPAPMDPLAAVVAYAVQAGLFDVGVALRRSAELDPEPESVAVRATSDSTTEIRCRFPVAVPQPMARVFRVTVEEVPPRAPGH